MSIISDLSRLLRGFYRNESGVYVVMTAIASFGLIGVVALAVDGTGILLDKARLQQGTEQAALALVSENNENRTDKTHREINRQSVSQEEIDAADGSSNAEKKLAAQQEKRNQEIAQGFVKNYLRTPYNDQSAYSSSKLGVTVDPEGFDIKCKPEKFMNAYGVEDQRTVCEISAKVHRRSWFYLNDHPNSFDKREELNSGAVFAKKDKSLVIPIDLVLTSDLSGSMTADVSGCGSDGKRWVGTTQVPCRYSGASRMDDLRAVVGEISDIMLPAVVPQGTSEHNRIGFVSFTFGGQGYKGNNNECVLPFMGNNKTHKFTLPYSDDYGRSGYNVGQRYYHNRYEYIRSLMPNIKNVNGGTFVKPRNGVRGGDMVLEYSLTKLMEPYLRYLNDDRLGLHNRYSQMMLETTVTDVRYENSERFIKLFNEFYDEDATLASIDKFDGSLINYPLTFPKAMACMRNTHDKESTSKGWFIKSEGDKVVRFMENQKPSGFTLVSSGMLIGANMLMDKHPNADAVLENSSSNTQRILLILSDGEDVILEDVSKNLIKNGMCDRIRDRVDTLQVDGYRKFPTKIAFVGFGDTVSNELKQLWRSCVGDKNYYEAKSRAELFDAFKQIINIDEEVGTIQNQKNY